MEMEHECSQEHTVAHHPALRRLLNGTHVRPAREVAEVETNRILDARCMSPPHEERGRFRRTVSVHKSRFLPIRGSGSQRRTGGSVRALRTYMWLNLRRSVALKDLVTLILRSQTGEYVQQR